MNERRGAKPVPAASITTGERTFIGSLKLTTYKACQGSEPDHRACTLWNSLVPEPVICPHFGSVSRLHVVMDQPNTSHPPAQGQEL